MKNTPLAAIAITLTLLAITACSKHEDNTVPMPEINDVIQKTVPQPISVPEQKHQAAAPNPAEVKLSNVVQDNSGKTVLYWYDPMVADKHFDKPGKSPFMDMQLEPKYAEGGNQGSRP